MIRDAHDANETTKPNDFELARLRAALPEYFGKDGDFRLDRLQEALSSADVSMTREGYELKFLGKSYAKYLTSTRTETVVVPDLEHNAEATNAESENLYIVGDNLDALKHLLGSYAGKVKCIYIDPPYNTGSDGFVYIDDFSFTAKDLVEKVGLDEDEAERVIALQGKSSHSAWLTFMYPRLELAKELLADDGVIFISIDDNEQANLRNLCDEVFGESSFVGTLVHQRAKGGGMAKHYVKGHDLIHVYSKSDKESAPRLSRPKVVQGHVVSRDGRDYLRDDDVLRKKFGKYDKGVERRCLYEEILEYHSEAKKREIDRRIEAGELVLEPFRDTGRHVIVEYKLIDEMSSALYSLLPIVQYLPDGRLDELGLSRHFTYPKPVELVKTLIRSVTPKGDRPLVMDFFSGSATTADAVMQLNSEDDGDRRCISVQIPEAVDADFEDRHVFATVDAVGRERIKRAADNIRNDSQFDVDYGFKLFRLEKPSAKTLDQLQSFDPNEDGVLLAGDFVSKFASNGTPGSQVALSTWLVQDGFGLTPTVNAVELDEYKLQVCEDSGYVIEPGLDSDDVMALVAKLEAGELDLKRLVVFGYSVPFSVMHELRQNLKSLRSGQVVSVIERY